MDTTALLWGLLFSSLVWAISCMEENNTALCLYYAALV